MRRAPGLLYPLYRLGLLDIDALGKAEGVNWVWGGADCLRPAYDRCLISLSRGGADADVQAVRVAGYDDAQIVSSHALKYFADEVHHPGVEVEIVTLTPEQDSAMRKAMEAEGFTVNDDEWWHYDYRDWQKYRIGNAFFKDL